MGLPGNPVDAYEAARDKYGTRKALEKAGLATPKAVQMWGEEQIPEAIAKVMMFVLLRMFLRVIFLFRAIFFFGFIVGWVSDDY